MPPDVRGAGGGELSGAEAPGWDAIDAAFAVLYPGVEPIHVAPEVGVAFGGSVEGISAYPASGRWHFVTYGVA